MPKMFFPPENSQDTVPDIGATRRAEVDLEKVYQLARIADALEKANEPVVVNAEK